MCPLNVYKKKKKEKKLDCKKKNILLSQLLFNLTLKTKYNNCQLCLICQLCFFSLYLFWLMVCIFYVFYLRINVTTMN